jgi:phytol kinase
LLQDRPYTLTWMLTQLAGGYVIILALYLYLGARGAGVVPPGAGRAILIPIVVNVFGDGLAEPVGIRFGRHKYRARALWYNGQFCAGEVRIIYFVSFFIAVLVKFSSSPGPMLSNG